MENSNIDIDKVNELIPHFTFDELQDTFIQSMKRCIKDIFYFKVNLILFKKTLILFKRMSC